MQALNTAYDKVTQQLKAQDAKTAQGGPTAAAAKKASKARAG